MESRDGCIRRVVDEAALTPEQEITYFCQNFTIFCIPYEKKSIHPPYFPLAQSADNIELTVIIEIQ